MPVHDWSRVDAGIFHAFHHGWIEELARALNRGVLPRDHYALPGQFMARLGFDVVLIMQCQSDADNRLSSDRGNEGLAKPTPSPTAETELDFNRRSLTQAVAAIGGDRVVTVIDVVAPETKSTDHVLRWFVKKAADLLDKHIHLLIADLLPPGPYDPNGIHTATWEEVTQQQYVPPQAKPLTLVAYESALTVRAFVRPVEVGSTLPDMPLFLEPNGCVDVPLETTYQAAFAAMPLRWRRVLERLE